MRQRLRWISETYGHAVVGIALCILMAACGTGIEMTEHVTDKDVRKVLEQADSKQASVTLEAYTDSLAAWKTGKRFWVADDQVKQMLLYSGFDLDSLHLAGHVLNYDGWVTSGLFTDDNRKVDIRFVDSITGQAFVYRYGKAVEAFRPGFTLPMLIDLDMVEHIARQVQGKDYYIRTPIWYDQQTEQMKDGRHFIKVHIDSVLPGNAVMPLRVLFTTADTRERAMVWMSDNASTMHGRDFDALFVASDPHLAHPEISDANWQKITRGQVAEGMTKIECGLALGSPKRINEIPDQRGMREYWYYDGGAYLFFVDGLLRQFNK